MELNRIWHYYFSFIAGKADEFVIPGDLKLREWIGDFLPREIGVIPLIEDKESMLRADVPSPTSMKAGNCPDDAPESVMDPCSG